MCWYSRTEMLRNKTYGKSLHHPRGHTNERISTSNNSELTPQGDRKKRTVKRLCVTNVTGLAITSVFCRDFFLTILRSGLFQKDMFKARWSLVENVFKHNYCHACHTRFAIMLRKFIIRPSLDPKLSLFWQVGDVIHLCRMCGDARYKCPKIHSLTKVGPYVLPQSLPRLHSTT